MGERQFKRKKTYVNYKEDDSVDTPSTSKWTDKDLKDYRIKVINVDVFPKSDVKYKDLVIPEWKNEGWLHACSVSDIKVSDNERTNNQIKTLIDTIKYIQKYKDYTDELYIDGFMNVILTILGFNEYPCKYYPQYSLHVEFGYLNHVITSKVDFGVMSKYNDKAMLVIEDKTVSNAHYSNDWKEPQVIGEIFVALHNDDIKTVYGIRVVHTLFTFYRSTINESYKNSNLKGKFNQGELVVERFPPINPSKRSLNALDICIYDQRIQILEHFSFIYNQLSLKIN